MSTRNPRWLTLFAACLIVVACDDSDIEEDEYIAHLNGANEVPANNSDATGTFFLEDDGDDIEFRLSVQNLNSPTMAHIHAGAPGENGGILVTLFVTATPPATFSGVIASGEFSASDIETLPGAVGPISMDSLRELLRTDGAYVNVHTVALPGGELRGTIVRD